MTSTQIYRVANLQILCLLVEPTDKAIWKFLSSTLYTIQWNEQLWVTPWSCVVWCHTSILSSSSSLSSPRTLFQLFMDRVWDSYKNQKLLTILTNSETARIFNFFQWSLLAIIVFLHLYSSKYIFILLYILTPAIHHYAIKFTCLHGFFSFSFVDTPEEEWVNEHESVRWVTSPCPFATSASTSSWIRYSSNVSWSRVLSLLTRMTNKHH